MAETSTLYHHPSGHRGGMKKTDQEGSKHSSRSSSAMTIVINQRGGPKCNKNEVIITHTSAEERNYRRFVTLTQIQAVCLQQQSLHLRQIIERYIG